MTRTAALSADQVSGLLQNLRRAVDALRPHLGTPEQQAELYVIEDALARLSAPRSKSATGLADFDPSRLSHLLEITGPAVGPELLARLIEDLTTTQAVLESGADTQDWKQLREGSHVLISLSGSVGALSLQAMSENLNAAAHRQDAGAIDTLIPPLTVELVLLIQLIRATRPPEGAAR